MAEDAVTKESQAIPQAVYKRREILKRAGKAAAAVGAAAVMTGGAGYSVIKGAEAMDNILNPHKPSEYYFGRIEVSLPDVNLRDEPKRHNVYYGDYRLSDISKINGKDYHNERILNLENVTIVEGSNPDAVNDEGIGKWIKIKVLSEALLGGERDAYISISDKTSGVMRFTDKGGYKKAQEVKNLPPEQINQTSFMKEFSK